MTSGFGLRLRELRAGRGYPTVWLAAKSGVGVGDLREIEAGRRPPTWDEACRLADALGLPLDAFRPGPAQDPLGQPV